MKFSIILCTYNRADLVTKTLNSLINQNFSKKKFEIVVVDNNSTDNTQNAVQKIVRLNPKASIYFFKERKQGKSHSCNKGIAESKNEFLIFLDDDELVNKDFLKLYEKNWKKFLKDKQIAMLGGKIHPYYKSLKAKKLHKIKTIEDWVLGLHQLGESIRELRFPDYLLAGNFSVKRSVAMKILGFNTNFGIRKWGFLFFADDLEFCYRLMKNGYKIVYLPEIIVFNLVTENRLDLKYQIKKYILGGIEIETLDRLTLSKSEFNKKIVIMFEYIYHILKNKYFFRANLNEKLQLIFNCSYIIHGISPFKILKSDNY